MARSNAGGGTGSEPDRRERVRRFLLDLTSLEVNTLVTENITGEPMPAPHQAIQKLGEQYASKLGTIAGKSGADRGGAEHAVAPPEPLDFEAQGKTAKTLLAQKPAGMTDHDQGHLARIDAHSEHLARLAGKLGIDKSATEAASLDSGGNGDGTARLDLEDVVDLRKIWELGTEPIALQTVIQMGGDLITRVHPDHAASTQTVLFDLHRMGIETAVGIWQTLVETTVQIVEKIIDR